VDRYGQPRKQVRVVTYYGVDNQIDGIVLDVLLKKHNNIRNSLGISVPVPIDTDQVIEAIFEGLLLRENTGHLTQSSQLLLPGMDSAWQRERDDLFQQWDATSEREKRSRTMFAQEGIKVDEVAAELAAVRSAIGSGVDVATFMETALAAQGASISHISQQGAETLQFDLSETPRAVRDILGNTGSAGSTSSVAPRFKARFELPVQEGTLYLSRTHPLVEGLAGYVMDVALDPIMSKGNATNSAHAANTACRCGVIRTSRVTRPRVRSDRRVQIKTTSARGNRSSRLTNSTWLRAARSGVSVGPAAITVRSRACPMRARHRPKRPSPTMPIVPPLPTTAGVLDA